MGIFSEYAPLYWGAGLPVIPLRERNKMPDITAWSAYGREMPSEAVREHWLAAYPNGNIGLPFGPASGLCAIDIDSEDEALVKGILEILPSTPWVRVGKKGMGLIYKWEGQKNFKLRGEDGGMIMEFLGLGNQMVMPHSIHPDTGRPYTSNTNLWEVLDRIEDLGEDIEDKLRALLGKAGFSLGAGGRSAPVDIVPAGERDVQMVRHAGYLSRVVLGIDKQTQFSLADAIAHMYTWVSDFTARVSGDDMDPGKGVLKLLEFLVKDVDGGRTMPEGWDAGLSEEWLVHPTIVMLASKNEAQRWTMTRACAWLGEKLAEKPTDPDWCMARVEDLISAVAKDDQFTETTFRAMVPRIVSLSGDLGLKKTDLVQAFKAARKGGSGEDTWEDHETIARMVLEGLARDGEIHFDQGKFWQWSGSCFKELPESEIYMAIASGVKGSTIVRRHNDYASVINVLKRMCVSELGDGGVERGLNFANGFVGEDLVIVDHDPKYGATFTLPFEYIGPEGGARCVRWFEFLHSVWGQEPDFRERVMLLQEMFAVTLFKMAPLHQKAFLLFGRAGTGKSVVLEVLRAMLPPDAVGDLGPQYWSDQFAPTNLVGKCANICGELPEAGVIAGNHFKEVVEGSVIRAAYKGVDAFSFRVLCAHWFSSNYMPMSRDSSRGFIRRWMILDFMNVIPEDQQIKGLAAMIVAEERQEIAAWALEGLRRVIEKGGYTEPACHVRRIEQLRRLNNSVQAFLVHDSVVARGEGVMKAREMYDQYSFYMRDIGRGSPVSFERFLQMVEDLDLDTEERTGLDGTREMWVLGVLKRERNAA